MVKMINWYTGAVMYVEESRVEEYLKKGHKLPQKPKPKPKRKKS